LGLYFAACADAACASAQINSIHGNAQAGIRPSITLGADGLPLMSYGRFGTGSSPNLLLARCLNAVCAPGQVVLKTIGLPAVTGSIASSIAIDAEDRPLVAYDIGDGTIRLLRCSDAACTGDSTVSLGTGIRPELLLGTDGLPVVAWTEGATLRTHHCASPYCS
jgi:hypothetical protein